MSDLVMGLCSSGRILPLMNIPMRTGTRVMESMAAAAMAKVFV